MTNGYGPGVAGGFQRVRRGLMLSTCAILAPGLAQAQTTISTATTATQNIGGSATLTVTATGSIISTSTRGVNFNTTATGSGNGPMISNSGTIQATSAGTGVGIDTSNTVADRTITINNLGTGSLIGGTDIGIRIRNGSGTDTSIASPITIYNEGMIQGGVDQGINITSIPNAAVHITNKGTVKGSSAIIAGTATIDNYGTVQGTALAASGTGQTANNGEGIRLNGGNTNGATNLINLYAGSVTTGTGSAGNAIYVKAGNGTTINVKSGATVNGAISMDTGTNTVNLETGATVAGAISGAPATSGTIDTLNATAAASGTTVATMPMLQAFDRINIVSGDWTFTSTAYATANGASVGVGAIARFGNGGSDGAILGVMTNNGTIVVDRTDTLDQIFTSSTTGITTYSPISGNGVLQLTGSGVYAMSNNVAGGTTYANSYSGNTLVDAGTLRGDTASAFSPNSQIVIGSAGTVDLHGFDQMIANLSGAGIVTNSSATSATLTTGSGNGDTSFSGTMSGPLAITKVGTGTLTLSGMNSATGGVTVAGGGLLISGSIAAPVTVASGATLGGGGTIGGTVSLADGAHVAPGNAAVGTLTTGTLTLGSGSVLDYQLGTPGNAAASDRIVVNGNLTLAGTLNVVDAGGFGYGVYRLIDYSGTLTDNGLTIGSTPAGTNTGLLSVQTAIGQQVNLIYGSSAVNPIQFWDGGVTSADGTIHGGSGSWTNTSTNWTSSDGTGNAAWNGNFAVFEGSAGTVTVDDAINFGGMQFLTDGYTVAAGTGTLSATETLTNLRADPGVTATISASIGGAGGLVKDDAGTIILSGADNYAGSTTVNGGTLRLLGASAVPATSAVTVASGAVLDVAASQSIGSLAGAGSVTLSGGTLTNGALNASTTFSGVVSGAGGFTETGTGTLTLTGANSWTGATSVTGGTLALDTGGAIGSGALAVASGATVDLDGIASSVGALSGAGRVMIGTDGSITTSNALDTSFTGTLTGVRASLTKAGAGTLTLSGANTYSGGTVVNSGRLVVANATALSNSGGVQVNAGGVFEIATDKTVGALSGAGTINLNSNRLTSSSAQTVAFAGVATGTGGLTKAGSGMLTLSGVNLYTGDTTVSAGTLSITGSVAGTASVATGGTLGGTGSVAGVVTVADGTIAPGTGGVGTLTVGGLILSANSVLSYDLGAPNTAGASDRIQVNGNLTLAGTLNASDAGGFGMGVYRLIDYTGALTDNGLVVGTLPSGYVAGQTQVQTSVSGQVNLVVGGALPDIQFWDGANTSANGTVDGGNGSWTATGYNWTDAAGDQNTPWGGKFAVFQGAAGTVTVNGIIGFTGLQFMTDGYTIAGGTGTFSTTDPSSAIRVDPGVTATISAAIGGSGGIQKLDAGTLVLTGADSYAGATVVNGGTLRAGGAGALPGTSAVSVASGATLDIAAGQTIASLAGAGNVTLSGGNLTTGGAGGSTSFGGIISGAGGLTKAGAGTFTLSGANSYSGGTTVSEGVLQLAGSGALGSGGLSIASGATMDLNSVSATVGALSGAGAITLGTATLTAGGSADSNFTGMISGNGGFTKAGTGNLTLSGANVYAGTTRVSGGTLTLANATAIPTTASVTIDSGATLALGASKTIGSLAGTGAVALGIRTLTVSSGNFGGAIGGTGALIKAGTGTLTLTGTNGYTGLTTVSGGTLSLGTGGSIASSSGVTLSASGATLDVAAAQTIGTLSGVTGSKITLEAALTESNTSTASFAGTLSGAGAFVKTGAGTLTLAAANSHSGGTTANMGTLRAGAVGAFGSGVLGAASGATVDLAGFAQTVSGLSGTGTITLGSAALSVGGATSSQFDGIISGTGSLIKTGSDTLTMTGANSYNGGTTISAGRLAVNGSLASAVTVGTGGTLGGTGTVGALTVQGTLSPGNSIGILNVTGNLNFAAGSIYQVEVNAAGQGDSTAVSGGITINGGTVQVLAASGTYRPQTDYAILTSFSGISGSFTGISSNLAFLTPSLLYNATTVTLRLTRNDISFGSVGITPNQIAVGTALGAAASGALVGAVAGLSAEAARNAYDTLSGEAHADVLTLANRDAQAGQRALLDRLAAPDSEGPSLWVQGLGDHIGVDANDGYAGVSASHYGVLAGAEYGRGGVRVGLAGGYSTTDADIGARASSVGIDTARVTIYAGVHADALHLSAGAGYLHHSVSVDRTILIGDLSDATTARYSGHTAQAFGEAGYSIGDARVSIEPFAGIAYARTSVVGAKETGGAAALALTGDRLHSTLATAGVRFGIAGLFGTALRLDGMLAGRRYLENDSGERTASLIGIGQSFAVKGADFGRTGGIARLGFSLPALGGTIGFSGDGDLAKDARTYGGKATVGWRF